MPIPLWRCSLQYQSNNRQQQLLYGVRYLMLNRTLGLHGLSSQTRHSCLRLTASVSPHPQTHRTEATPRSRGTPPAIHPRHLGIRYLTPYLTPYVYGFTRNFSALLKDTLSCGSA